MQVRQLPDVSEDEQRVPFPELDEAARQRAEARAREGADPHAAYAAESVAVQMLRVYN